MAVPEPAEMHSDESIVSRMASLGKPRAPEAAPEKPAPVEPAPVDRPEPEAPELQAASSEETPESEGGETDQAVDEDTFDFTADDGEVIKLPSKMRGAVDRTEDYTRKTTEVAILRNQAEDRMMFAEAREQLATAVFEDVAQLKALQADLNRFKTADWAAIYQENPGQVLMLQRREKELEAQVNAKTQEIQAQAEHINQASKSHSATQWRLAEQAAVQRMGNITEADNVAMAKEVQALGFTVNEFKSRFADPRVIQAVHKAAKWDALQASKPSAQSAVRNAPPVVRPGATKGPGVATETKYREQRAVLKKSGRLEDAARLFKAFNKG